MARRYNNVVCDAGVIASEVVTRGESRGWAGAIEERDEVARILAPFKIVYKDDFHGLWARGEPEPQGFDPAKRLAELESDEVLVKYECADVQINSVLALTQTAMHVEALTLRRVLGMPLLQYFGRD